MADTEPPRALSTNPSKGKYLNVVCLYIWQCKPQKVITVLNTFFKTMIKDAVLVAQLSDKEVCYTHPGFNVTVNQEKLDKIEMTETIAKFMEWLKAQAWCTVNNEPMAGPSLAAAGAAVAVSAADGGMRVDQSPKIAAANEITPADTPIDASGVRVVVNQSPYIAAANEITPTDKPIDASGVSVVQESMGAKTATAEIAPADKPIDSFGAKNAELSSLIEQNQTRALELELRKSIAVAKAAEMEAQLKENEAAKLELALTEQRDAFQKAQEAKKQEPPQDTRHEPVSKPEAGDKTEGLKRKRDDAETPMPEAKVQRTEADEASSLASTMQNIINATEPSMRSFLSATDPLVQGASSVLSVFTSVFRM